MSSSNRALVGDALELVVKALEPFVARVLAEIVPHDAHWSSVLSAKDARAGFAEPTIEPHDLMPMLRVLTERLGPYGFPFARAIPAVAGTHANELRSVRNAWAHFRPLDAADTFRALDTAERLLRMIGADTEADQIVTMMARPFAALAASAPFAAAPASALSTPSALPTERSTPEAEPVESLHVQVPSVLDDTGSLVWVGGLDDDSVIRSQPPIDAKAARIEAEDGATAAEDIADALRIIIAGMTAPRAMTAVAQQLITRFGRESVGDWGGAGSFTKFVQRTEPRAKVTGPPWFLQPLDPAEAAAGELEPAPALSEPQHPPGGAPESMRALTEVDPAIPLIPWTRMNDTISAVLTAGPLDGRGLQTLTRSGIDVCARKAVANAASGNRLVAKSDASWVISVLRSRHRSQELLTLPIASSLVTAHITELAGRAGVDPARFRDDVHAWVSAADH